MVTRRRQHNHFVTSQQVESLVQLLAVTHAQYVGFMQWQATCALATDVEQDAPHAAYGHATREQPCNGCWGGYFSAPRACPWTISFGARMRARTPHCPTIHRAPFACGPLEVRSLGFARQISRCTYAFRYLRAMSQRSLHFNMSAFKGPPPICTSTDGGQGHVIGMCTRSVDLLDLGASAQKYAMEKEMPPNGSVGALVVHPIKLPILKRWDTYWRRLLMLPYQPVPMVQARVADFASERRNFSGMFLPSVASVPWQGASAWRDSKLAREHE
mmetsp:Transcript_10295/g.23532  ORF Transcript_10295/g.23532 Transcript_10295/m.23532 type:complete len:272 (-) Transcript_10295:165-980(-)